MVNFTKEVDDKTFADATKVLEEHEYREEICVMDDMCTWTHRDVQSLAVDNKMHSTMCTMCTSAHLSMHSAQQSGDQPIFQYNMYQQMRQSMAERMLRRSSQWHAL